MKDSTVAFGVSALFAIAAYYRYAFRRRQTARWDRVQAHVVDLSKDGNCGTAPILKFTPKGSDQSVVLQSRLFVTGARHRVGEKVVVAYDPQDPAKASIAAGWEIHFIAIWLLGVSLMTLFGAAFALSLGK